MEFRAASVGFEFQCFFKCQLLPITANNIFFTNKKTDGMFFLPHETE